MNKISDLSYDILAKGIYLKPDELRSYLNQYEKIAFSNKNYDRYRIDYHIMFLNNSAVFDKRGEAMYFAEKVKREYILQGQHSLIEVAQKCQIFSIRKNFKKVIEAYQKEKDFIGRLPDLLAQDKINPRIALDAFHVLSPVSASYSAIGDSLSLFAVYDLSEKIVKNLRPKIINPYNLLLTDLHLLEQQFFKAAFKEDYNTCSSILNEVEKLKAKYDGQTNTDFINLALIEWKADFYIRTEKIDSAEYYLKKYNALPQLTNDIKERIMLYTSKVEFLKGNYKSAFLQMQEANILSDSIKTDLTGELDDLLYSYTKAEDTQNALRIVEKVKQDQKLLILGLCSLFVIIISFIIWSRIRKNKIIQSKITRLNNIANIQIATIEEMAFQAVKKEQQRLGQDLHDSASSQLAAIKCQLDLLLSEKTDEKTDEKTTLQLLNIQKNLENVYITTRSKSHEWLALPDGKDEIIFSKQIETNLKLIFPSPRINKTVEIDEGVLQEMNSEQKIELLKIIQEAITNIIKHAKPKNILLLLYKENNDSFSLIIKNDGISSSKIKQDGAGITSIISRATKMGGNVNIDTQDKFEIYINIPYNLVVVV